MGAIPEVVVVVEDDCWEDICWELEEVVVVVIPPMGLGCCICAMGTALGY